MEKDILLPDTLLLVGNPTELADMNEEIFIEKLSEMPIDVGGEEVIPNDEKQLNRECVVVEGCIGDYLGKVFPSIDDAYNWYNQYAFQKGFGTRIHWTAKSKKNNEIIRRRYVCDKEGFKNVKDVGGAQNVKRFRDTRTGCLAMMEIRLEDSMMWVICKFNDTHNHALSTPSKVFKHRSHSTFHKSKVCRELIDGLSSSGVRPAVISRTVNALIGGHEDVTPKQCSTYIGKERRSNVGKECLGIIKHFHDKSTNDDSFFFSMNLGDDCTFKSVFWADGRSRDAYKQFGDVLVFDVTYKTNKFKMPFAPFVGVNHHRQSILFGGALLEDETEDTFVWLFEQFLRCMHNNAPRAVITDQDKAIGNAIKKVFSSTRHRFCSWHINKHMIEHLSTYRAQYDDFNEKYRQLIKSNTVEQFEQRWDLFQIRFNIEANSWLRKMYTLREHWVGAYLKDHFFAGMTSSGRSESIHSFFDGYLNSNTMLNDFVIQYDVAVKARRDAENDEDFKTLNSTAVLYTGHPIEVQLAKCYTRAVFNIFQVQWKKGLALVHEKIRKEGNVVTYRVGCLQVAKELWRIVTFEAIGESFRSSCSCAKFETEGILCKHILSIIFRKSIVCIPRYYILDRWTIGVRFRASGIECAPIESPHYDVWSIRTRVNKFLQDGQSHPSLLKKLSECVDSLINQVADLEGNQQYRTTNVSAVVESTSSAFPHVRDPSEPVKSKGRPKIATRFKSGLEMSQDSKKKRTCGYCGEKGHYITGCAKRKEMLEECHMVKNDN